MDFLDIADKLSSDRNVREEETSLHMIKFKEIIEFAGITCFLMLKLKEMLIWQKSCCCCLVLQCFCQQVMHEKNQ